MYVLYRMKGVKDMDSNQMPIGLGLSLAMNQKAMDRFSDMTEAEKEQAIARSRKGRWTALSVRWQRIMTRI